jgi:autotransporter-associated beta strand protein
VATAPGSTVTLTGDLELRGPVSIGAAASASGGIGITLANRITATGADRTLFLGQLLSRFGDSWVPARGLDTRTLDDAGAGSVWGPVTFGPAVVYGMDAPQRLVLGLGRYRLAGASDRLPRGAQVVLHAGAASSVAALQSATLQLDGVTQEFGGLDSEHAGNTAADLAVIGGPAGPSVLAVNVAAGGVSTFSGRLGGAGLGEGNLTLEKLGGGTWNLAGVVAHQGDTRVRGGVLAFTGAARPPAAGVWLIEGGGRMTVAGDAVFPAATRVRVAAPSLQPCIHILGTAALAGSLIVELAGVAPAVGEAVPLVQANAWSGAFASITLPPRTLTGPALRVVRTGDAVVLRGEATSFEVALHRAGAVGATESVTAVEALGDLDGDGFANLLEYACGMALSGTGGVRPHAIVVGGRARLVFSLDTRVPDAALVVEASGAPSGPWTEVARREPGASWVGGAVVVEEVPDAAGVARVAVEDTTSVLPRFLRVRAVWMP